MKANARTNGNRIEDPVAMELAEIKRLLVLLLLKAGASQGEIGVALNSSQPTISRQFPFGELTPITVSGEGR